jgi:4-hydroxy-tetrahydrodipicolinate reductase
VTAPSRLAVVGASGRMGRAIVRLAHEAGIPLVSAIGASDIGKDAGELAGVGALGAPITQDVDALVAAKPDCIIDFTAPALFPSVCAAAIRANAPLVCGTTGFGNAESEALMETAKKIAVLWEPNMSVGVHLLASLVEKAVVALGDSCDIEIVEAHHKLKVDSPSGTAVRLAEVAKRARDESAARAKDRPDSAFVYGRVGKPGPRKPNEIGVHAIRGGDVIGDHTVHLLCAGERIELTHRASSRDLFASGAIRAARFIVGKKAGRYTMNDVLA